MARAGIGKIVNRSELCQIMGISSPTIDNWEKRGMPVQKKGGKGVANEYNTMHVIKWWAGDAASPGAVKLTSGADPKDRKTAAEAEIKEIELAEKKGEVVPIDTAIKGFIKHVAACKAKLLAIPTKAAPMVVVMTEIEETRAALDDMIRDALTELSAGVEVEPDGE